MPDEFDRRFGRRERRVRAIAEVLATPPELLEQVFPADEERRERVTRAAKILYRQFRPAGAWTSWADEPSATQDWYLSIAEGLYELYDTGRYAPPNHFIRRRE